MEKKNNSLIVMAYYKCLHNTHRAPASQKVLLDITVKERERKRNPPLLPLVQ